MVKVRAIYVKLIGYVIKDRVQSTIFLEFLKFKNIEIRTWHELSVIDFYQPSRSGNLINL